MAASPIPSPSYSEAPVAEKKTEAAPNVEAAPAEDFTKLPKIELVRRALATMKGKAKPAAIQSEILNRFGITLTTQQISSCKGDIAKHARQKAARKPQAMKAAPEPAPAAAASRSQSKSPAIHLEDVLATRAMVDRLGLDGLRNFLALVDRVGVDHLRALLTAFQR